MEPAEPLCSAYNATAVIWAYTDSTQAKRAHARKLPERPSELLLGGSVAYVVPSMPTPCRIWTAGAFPPAAPRLATVCQLRYNPGISAQNYVSLLLPAGTDVRGQYHTGGSDLIEVPAGSGRLYLCVWVDDTALGFTNVHRQAVCVWQVPFITPTP